MSASQRDPAATEEAQKKDPAWPHHACSLQFSLSLSLSLASHAYAKAFPQALKQKESREKRAATLVVLVVLVVLATLHIMHSEAFSGFDQPNLPQPKLSFIFGYCMLLKGSLSSFPLRSNAALKFKQGGDSGVARRCGALPFPYSKGTRPGRPGGGAFSKSGEGGEGGHHMAIFDSSFWLKRAGTKKEVSFAPFFCSQSQKCFLARTNAQYDFFVPGDEEREALL